MATFEKLGESSSNARHVAEPLSWRERPNYGIPSSVVLIVPSAGALGLMIGIARGAQQARLQFLAENAHRPPTTVRGWYFYNRTKNYRIMQNALSVGGKLGVRIAAVSLGFVFLYEGIGWARERYVGVRGASTTKPDGVARGTLQRHTWRRGEPRFIDGLSAGTLSGVATAVFYRLPRQTTYQVVSLGAVCGAIFSGAQAVQSYASSVVDQRAGAAAQVEAAEIDAETTRQAALVAEREKQEAARKQAEEQQRQQREEEMSLRPSASSVPVDMLLEPEPTPTLVDRAKGWFGGGRRGES